MARETAERPQNRSIEGLRGLAALLVVMSHCLGIGGFTLGVDLFFVLSGFLITRLLVGEMSRDGHISLSRFYIRRAFRLLPALAVFLVVVLIWAQTLGSPSAAATIHGTVLSGLLYVENWHIFFAGPTTPGLLIDPATHTWSLSIEEQFYLLWPILLIGGWRWKGARGALALAVCGVALAMIDRMGLALVGTTLGRVYFSSDMRADQLLAGCSVALLAHLGWLPRVPRGLSVSALGALLAIGIHPFPLQYQMTATTLLGGVLVAGLSQHQLSALSTSWMVWLGGRSYALYLWHPFVRVVLHDHAHLPDGGLMFVAVLTLSLAISDVTFRVVERPLRDLGRRLTSAGQVASAGSAAAVAVAVHPVR